MCSLVKRFRVLMTALPLMVLAACGGGGGGNGGGSAGGSVTPVAYRGSTTQAAISETNAKRFFDILFGESSTTSDLSMFGVAVAPEPGIPTGPNVLHIGTRLRGYLTAEQSQITTVRATAVVINETHNCVDGGTVRLTGTLDDNTGVGNLTARFSNCTDEDGALTGEAAFHIRSVDPLTRVATDLVIDIKLLRFTTATADVSVSGTISTQRAAGTETETLNVVMFDNQSGRLSKTEDLQSYFLVGQSAWSLTGRIYDSIEGFVAVSTVNPMRYSASMFPWGGGPLVLTGSGGTSLAIRPISSIDVELYLNNGSDNLVATIAWGSPDQPVFTPPRFMISVTVTGLAGTNLVLVNGADSLTISASLVPSPPGAERPTFATPLPTGAPYNVTVAAQPESPFFSQTCTVLNGSGIVGNTNIALVVECVGNPFSVSVNVTGLSGSGLVLRLYPSGRPTEDLPISSNGLFTFSTPVLSGRTYSVYVVVPPDNPAQACIIDGGYGTVGNTNIILPVICITPK